MDEPKRKRQLTKEEVAEYKRRVYNFGSVDRFMRSKIGACDRYGKPAQG